MPLPDRLPTLGLGSVRLRKFDVRDVHLVVSAANDPLIPLITTVPTSGIESDAVAYIERQHARLVDGTGFSFAIAKAESDEAVGQIGLWLRDIEDGRATVGYWVGPDHRRHGYLTDALEALTTWGLGLDGVERLQLSVEPWNEGSWRAAERCGYMREGLLRSWQRVGSARKDMYMYSLVRESTASL